MLFGPALIFFSLCWWYSFFPPFLYELNLFGWNFQTSIILIEEISRANAKWTAMMHIHYLLSSFGVNDAHTLSRQTTLMWQIFNFHLILFSSFWVSSVCIDCSMIDRADNETLFLQWNEVPPQKPDYTPSNLQDVVLSFPSFDADLMHQTALLYSRCLPAGSVAVLTLSANEGGGQRRPFSCQSVDQPTVGSQSLTAAWPAGSISTNFCGQRPTHCSASCHIMPRDWGSSQSSFCTKVDVSFCRKQAKQMKLEFTHRPCSRPNLEQQGMSSHLSKQEHARR